MTDEPWSAECVCQPPDCTPECEACEELGFCVPGFMRRDGPTEKDKRRDGFRRRNGA